MHDPENYENNKGGPKAACAMCIPYLISQMTWMQSERILDYGCGAGSTAMQYFMPQAELHDLEIIGVDLFEEMILHAKNSYSHPRIRFVVGNIMDNSFLTEGLQEDAKFDKIFSIFVFHFIKDYGEAIRRLGKLLKPGGEFAFMVLGKHSFVFDALRHVGRKYADSYMKGYEQFLSKWFEDEEDAEECFCKAIQSAGYRIIRLSTEKGCYEESIETSAGICISLNPYINNFPAAIRETDLRDEYQKFLTKSLSQNSIYCKTKIHHQVVVGLIGN